MQIVPIHASGGLQCGVQIRSVWRGAFRRNGWQGI
jgi:hypothetical protein